MDDDDKEMQVLSKAYIGRIAQIFQQSQHLSSASSSSHLLQLQKGRREASQQPRQIAAMVSDGPTIGMSAGNAMSAENHRFFARYGGVREGVVTERTRWSEDDEGVPRRESLNNLLS